MIWADDDEWQVVLHANFNLSSLGGNVFLTNGSQTLDQVTYGSQTPDISFGRFPNGTGAFQSMSTTFNANNSGNISLSEWTEEMIQIYPNPTKDVFQIQTSDPFGELLIYDVTGNVIHIEKSSSNSLKVEAQHWANGIYMIAITTASGKRIHKKVVKQ
jgi:hypothetical protein